MRPTPRVLPRRRARLTRIAFALSTGLLAVAAGCSDENSTAVTSGSIGGVAFTVVSGTIHQPLENGAIRADAAGGEIVLAADPEALGMSDPSRLHLRTQFALQHGGTITIGAFGGPGDPFGPGTAVVIGRNNSQIQYAFYVDSEVFADSTFVPSPPAANDVHWIVTEFYAADVPGYGAGSGLAMWPLNDLAPALGDDVLGCTLGPAMHATPMVGDRVGYRLTAGFLVGIEVIDTIIGPCV
jgi:hypothetical protein